MNSDIALYFRDEFRLARASAFRDAESFEEVIFVLERMGSFLNNGEGTGIGSYKDVLRQEAANSPLAFEIPADHREYHTPFEVLLDLVKDGRNSALHEGSFARHLTTHTIELSLIMEDALMDKSLLASEFMVNDPICAQTWQPLSIIRQKMLVNSFSYLPVYAEYRGETRWCVISDYSLAEYLRKVSSKGERKKHLAALLSETLEQNTIELSKPRICNPNCPISDIINDLSSLPILVTSERGNDSELLGIITAFDLL